MLKPATCFKLIFNKLVILVILLKSIYTRTLGNMQKITKL